MKKLLYSLLFLFLGLVVSNAQERYVDYVFDEDQIVREDSLVYGANFTVLALPITGHSLKRPLFYDLYHPDEDNPTPRPLIIYMHTGNFLPAKLNGSVSGSQRDPSTVEACKRLARLGYVVASIDYRLGWNPLAESQEDKNYTLINAAYRGVQDARTAVRYFKKTVVEENNRFNIDTSRIVLWGQGTGGYISYAAASLDNYSKIPNTTMPEGKFLLSNNGETVPMVIEQLNGDLYGTSVGVSAKNPVIPDGDTLCVPNHVGYSSDFQLAVNMGGALGDISWIDENTVPIISTQVPADLFAPYKSFTLQVGTATGPQPVVEVQGALLAQQKLSELGVTSAWADIDDEITQAAKANSAAAMPIGVEEVGHDYYPGLLPFNRPVVTSPLGTPVSDSSPWELWDQDFWSTEVHPLAGQFGLPDDFSFNDFALVANPDMSIEKCHTYLDSIIGFFAPRAAITLKLDELTAVQKVSSIDANFSISPNPANQFLDISTEGRDYEMKSIQIYDLSGREVKSITNLNSNRHTFENLNLTSGIYIVKATLDQGIISQRLVVQ